MERGGGGTTSSSSDCGGVSYEEVYLHAYETVYEAQEGVARYLTFYNQVRPHRALERRTPEDIYNDHLPARHVAA
jgi:putative transposase